MKQTKKVISPSEAKERLRDAQKYIDTLNVEEHQKQVEQARQRFGLQPHLHNGASHVVRIVVAASAGASS
jgi:hypothetical protein